MYDTAIIDLLWTGRAVMPADVLDGAASLIGRSQPSFRQSCVALSVNQQVKAFRDTEYFASRYVGGGAPTWAMAGRSRHELIKRLVDHAGLKFEVEAQVPSENRP